MYIIDNALSEKHGVCERKVKCIHDEAIVIFLFHLLVECTCVIVI